MAEKTGPRRSKGIHTSQKRSPPDSASRRTHSPRIHVDSEPGKLAVMARRHSGDCLELPTEGRLVTKPAVKGYLPEGGITVPQTIGGGLYPEPRQKLPGGNLQQGTHEAFKTAKREVRSRN